MVKKWMKVILFLFFLTNNQKYKYRRTKYDYIKENFMNENTNRHSCRTCIWNDQCEDEQPCAFYDDGSNEIDLSDAEIEQRVENGRRKFRNEYWKYMKEYDDGKSYE